QRSPSVAEQKRLTTLVRQLGDREFTIRRQAATDLIAAGPSSAHPLYLALADPDPEVAKQARRCLRAVEGDVLPDTDEAAARVLARYKSKDTLSVLLAYLPFAPDEGVQTVVARTLLTCHTTRRSADPILLAALKSHSPAQRATAAYVLGEEIPP